jgi:hypothetical protein
VQSIYTHCIHRDFKGNEEIEELSSKSCRKTLRYNVDNPLQDIRSIWSSLREELVLGICACAFLEPLLDKSAALEILVTVVTEM